MENTLHGETSLETCQVPRPSASPERELLIRSPSPPSNSCEREPSPFVHTAESDIQNYSTDETGPPSDVGLSPTLGQLDFTRRAQPSGSGLGLRSQDASALLSPGSIWPSSGGGLDFSNNIGRQSGQCFPPPYGPYTSYILGEYERLRRENANLKATLQLLR